MSAIDNLLQLSEEVACLQASYDDMRSEYAALKAVVAAAIAQGKFLYPDSTQEDSYYDNFLEGGWQLVRVATQTGVRMVVMDTKTLKEVKL